MTDNDYCKRRNLVFALVVVLDRIVNISSESVTLSCSNGSCRTCINDFKCYPRQFKSIRVQSNCPVAVCDDYCSNFVQGLDGCSVCQCNGFCTREPCNSLADCQSTALKCENFICVYQSFSGNFPYSGSLFENTNNNINTNGAWVQNVNTNKQPSFPSFPWLPNFPNLNNNGHLFGGRN